MTHTGSVLGKDRYRNHPSNHGNQRAQQEPPRKAGDPSPYMQGNNGDVQRPLTRWTSKQCPRRARLLR